MTSQVTTVTETAEVPRVSPNATDAPPEVLECTRNSDIDRLISTLASAFLTDPVMLHILGPLPPDPTLHNLFRSWLSVKLRERRDHGVVHALPDESCVALWAQPGHAHRPLLGRLIGWPFLFAILGRRLGHFQRMLRTTERQHPPEPHVYLQCLGTHPDHQGKGAGGRTIRRMLKDCDRDGLPAYTESSNPRNLPFYKRQGFRVIGGVEGLPDGFPVMTRLYRPPQDPSIWD